MSKVGHKRQGEKRLPPIPHLANLGHGSTSEDHSADIWAEGSSSSSSWTHDSFRVPFSTTLTTSSSALGLSLTTLPNPSLSTIRAPSSPSVASTNTTSSFRGKKIFPSKSALRSDLSLSALNMDHSDSPDHTRRVSDGRGVEKKRSALALGGIAKGLNRMGSVMKRNASEGSIPRAVDRDNERQKGKKKWNPSESLPEEINEWQSIGVGISVVQEDEGDAGVSLPFNVAHELHVSPDLGNLPPAWISSLRAQGMTEADILLIAATKKKQTYSQPMLRLVKGSEPPRVRDFAASSSSDRLGPPDGSLRERGASTPTPVTELRAAGSISSQKKKDRTHQRKASEMLQKFSFETSRPSSQELSGSVESTPPTPEQRADKLPPTIRLSGATITRVKDEILTKNDSSGSRSPRTPPKGERKRLSKHEVPRGLSSEEETTSHSAHSAHPTDSEPEPESDVDAVDRAFTFVDKNQRDKDKKRLSDQIRGFGNLNFSDDGDWADGLLSVVNGGLSRVDEAGPAQTSTWRPLSPKSNGKRASRRIQPHDFFASSTPGIASTPRRHSIKPVDNSVDDGEKIWPRSPPPPKRDRNDRRHSNLSSQITSNSQRPSLASLDRASRPSSPNPDPDVPVSSSEDFPIRKSSDSFGVHYSKIRSSPDLNLVTPSTHRPPSASSSGGVTPLQKSFEGTAKQESSRSTTSSDVDEDTSSGVLVHQFPQPPEDGDTRGSFGAETLTSPLANDVDDNDQWDSSRRESRRSSEETENERDWFAIAAEKFKHHPHPHVSVPASAVATDEFSSRPGSPTTPESPPPMPLPLPTAYTQPGRSTPVDSLVNPLPVVTLSPNGLLPPYAQIQSSRNLDGSPPELTHRPSTPVQHGGTRAEAGSADSEHTAISQDLLFLEPLSPNSHLSPSSRTSLSSLSNLSNLSGTRLSGIDPDDPLRDLDKADVAERASIALSIMSTNSSLSYSLHEATVQRAYSHNAQVLVKVKEDEECSSGESSEQAYLARIVPQAYPQPHSQVQDHSRSYPSSPSYASRRDVVERTVGRQMWREMEGGRGIVGVGIGRGVEIPLRKTSRDNGVPSSEPREDDQKSSQSREEDQTSSRPREDDQKSSRPRDDVQRGKDAKVSSSDGESKGEWGAMFALDEAAREVARSERGLVV
ncbi:hypothetical protein TREMEDRAFT_63117 [Tremella mesenterica DSM 1558]|uniref:uncharacterized protein n=1 Tax=Tremella mesenterica (strain ATCC 24925 / CBS 8224 / DSM 1558 / NBRC 9311 / NRRL Y-6157 / RJB 2259-6 / UBC 559-6) TaxID=578456 RepID=UPI0003F4A459|nr:uncharacterized protein TREMEDRAFT_63117 [Tremella mesenterica DSM 1558]EIW68650.1 hypothetical protein TREMEDRAFT_63117 [Tremella mesenterica DSM 1558]